MPLLGQRPALQSNEAQRIASTLMNPVEMVVEDRRPQCDDLLRQAREQLSALMEEISVDALSVPASKGLAS